MAAGFAATADEAEIEDTLLHEIAHALVGRRHHHDAVWQAKAREIGCSARRCHDVSFSEPALIACCVNGCFAVGRHRSRRNMRCRRCGGAVTYMRAASQVSGQALALAAARDRSSAISPSMPPRPTTSSNSER